MSDILDKPVSRRSAVALACALPVAAAGASALAGVASAADEDPTFSADNLGIVLFDTDQCSFTVNSYELDGDFTMGVTIVNKTSSTTLAFKVMSASANGWMCDPYWSATLDPGASSDEEITWSSSKLEARDIDEVTWLQFKVRVRNDDDALSDDILNDLYDLYPEGEEAYVAPTREPEEGETPILDEAGLVAIAEPFEPYAINGLTVTMYNENNTDEEVVFSASDVSVQGWMLDPHWSVSVMPGMRATSKLSWRSGALSDLGVKMVDDVEFTLTVKDTASSPATLAEVEARLASYEGDTSSDDDVVPIDQVIVDDDSYAVTVTGYEIDDDGDLTIHTNVENRTEDKLNFALGTFKANGGDCGSTSSSSDVTAGKKAKIDTELRHGTLEDAGVESADDVETVSFILTITQVVGEEDSDTGTSEEDEEDEEDSSDSTSSSSSSSDEDDDIQLLKQRFDVAIPARA